MPVAKASCHMEASAFTKCVVKIIEFCIAMHVFTLKYFIFKVYTEDSCNPYVESSIK